MLSFLEIHKIFWFQKPNSLVNILFYLIPWDKWRLSHSFEWNKELHYRTHFIAPLSGISELHYPTQRDK
jgi:hypothetical protein